MRNTLWVLCGLVAAAPAFAAEADPCKRNKELFLQEAAKYDCPDEEAEGKALTCSGNAAADIKPTKRFYELLKACKAKPKKGGASASGAKDAKPADMKPAASNSGELPPGKHVYRALDADGKVLAMAGSDKSGGTALGDVKDKVRADKCAGRESITVTLQFYKGDGKWSKGSPEEVKCKK